MARKSKKQDTVNYTLRKGRRVVYKVITNDPERRAKEHKAAGKIFTSMTTSRKVSSARAQKILEKG